MSSRTASVDRGSISPPRDFSWAAIYQQTSKPLTNLLFGFLAV
jgi:hypothetical protein